MKYEYWFANINEISNQKKKKIRERVKSAKVLYYIEETERKNLEIEEKDYESIRNSIEKWDLEEEYEKLNRKNVQFFTIQMEEYPSRLKEIHSAPYVLYVKGRLPKGNVLAAAIVGARECSQYGEMMAREFAEKLSYAGVQIISGMARGVDGAGQCGALRAGGESYGVLGCGVDICYPRDNIGLYQELQERGGLISEQPLGTRPLPQFFPARNRIISGLADMALEQGKDVYALPGPINSSLSRGCNYLIKQGAGILISPEDLLEDLSILSEKNLEKRGEKKLALESEENIVYSCLGLYPKNVGELLNLTKMPVPTLTSVLVSLELKGYIKEISKNYYVKI